MSIVNLVLPQIAHDLSLGFSGLQHVQVAVLGKSGN